MTGADTGAWPGWVTSRHRFVIGNLRSRPNALNEIFGPGGYWRRLNSAASTIRITFSTRSSSNPAATRSVAPASCST